VLAALASLRGARQATGWRPDLAWPVWARALPRAAATAVGVLLVTGLAAVVAGLIVHRPVVLGLFGAAAADAHGTILLALLQVAYLPNLIVWGAAWTTGSGFALGGDSVVVLMGQTVDAIPGFPVFGALPASPVASWWALFWLAGGVVAGAAAALIVLRARPRARFDETALVGGAAGIAGGLAFWLLALVTRGNLGVDRMTGLGPLVRETLVLVPAVLGFAGLVTGLVAGLLRAPGRSAETPVVEQVARTVTLWTGDDAAGGGEGVAGADAEATRQLDGPVHFGPHNVTAAAPAYAAPTDSLADPGPLQADTGPLDLTAAETVTMTAALAPTVALNPFGQAGPGPAQPALDFDNLGADAADTADTPDDSDAGGA
jgi:hypothetical protein